MHDKCYSFTNFRKYISVLPTFLVLLSILLRINRTNYQLSIKTYSESGFSLTRAAIVLQPKLDSHIVDDFC